MRCCICIIVLCLWALPAAAQVPGLTGIIVDISKDENTPTGSITVVDVTGKPQKFVVTQLTQFEILRGNQATPSSFLGEHKGEKAAIVVQPGVVPPTAARVQILLPPPPAVPVGIVRPNPEKKHIHGTIVAIYQDLLVLHLIHKTPPPPVLGQVVDVSRDADTNYGFITIQTGPDQVQKFVVNRFTHFLKIKWDGTEPANFLSDFKGETVVVFPRLGNLPVAGKVEIVLDGLALATHRVRHHHAHHWMVFQVTPATRVDLARDGKRAPANLNALQVGEQVSLVPHPANNNLAQIVHILLPHTIHGHVVGLTPEALAVKVHHHGNMDVPPLDMIATLPIVPATVVESVTGKDKKLVPVANLQQGQKVVVYAFGLPPYAAERVVVSVPAVKNIKIKGFATNLVNGNLVVTVNHPARGGKPAHTTQETFQLTPATQFKLVQGKNQQPSSLSALRPNQEVTVHGRTTAPQQALLVEMHVPTTPGKTSGKKK
jgi:hypothetical protein